jgi:hypothetical protein
VSITMYYLCKQYGYLILKVFNFPFWIGFCLIIQGCGKESENKLFSLISMNSQAKLLEQSPLLHNKS